MGKLEDMKSALDDLDLKIAEAESKLQACKVQEVRVMTSCHPADASRCCTREFISVGWPGCTFEACSKMKFVNVFGQKGDVVDSIPSRCVDKLVENESCTGCGNQFAVVP